MIYQGRYPLPSPQLIHEPGQVPETFIGTPPIPCCHRPIKHNGQAAINHGNQRILLVAHRLLGSVSTPRHGLFRFRLVWYRPAARFGVFFLPFFSFWGLWFFREAGRIDGECLGCGAEAVRNGAKRTSRAIGHGFSAAQRACGKQFTSGVRAVF